MTSCRSTLFTLIFASACAFASDGAAQELAEPVRFVRPANPKPLGRIDGRVRGDTNANIDVIPMTPSQDGAMTATAQPTVYWFLSAQTDRSATFSIRQHRSRAPTPIFECEVRGPIAAGVHEIRLADYAVSLDSNADYSWFVSLTGGSKPITTTSFIVVPDLAAITRLRQELATVSPEGRYKLYARNSFWYDALATIVGLLKSIPLSSHYRNRYLELLKDGGLDDVAARYTPPPTASACTPRAR